MQLFAWLLIHPSAWGNHIARIDPDLPPDFYLAELNRAQWRNPALRQLLIRGFVVWPLLVGLGLWLSGTAGASQIFGTTPGAIGGVVVAVAISVALGLAGGLTVSVALGIVSGVVGSLAFSLATTLPAGVARTAALVILVGLVLGVAGNAAFGAARIEPQSHIRPGRTYSAARQMSGIVTGILIGIVGTILASSLAISMAGSVAFSTARAMIFGATGGGTINVARGLAFGVAGSIAVGIAVGRRTSRRRGLIFGLLFGTMLGSVSLIAVEVGPGLTGMVNAALLTALFALSYVLAERMAGPWAGAVAGALASGGIFFLSIIGNYPRWPILPIGVICIMIGLTMDRWRPILFYPLTTVWNLLLFRADERRPPQPLSSLRRHSVFWDEYQRLPYLGLADHLLLVLSRNPAEGQAALDYLAASRHRAVARTVQIELDARRLEACDDVTAIGQAHHTLGAGELTGPASALLRSFSRLSRDVEAALRQETAYNQRLALSTVEERLDGLLRELTRSSEPYAARFQPVTAYWRRILADHIGQLTATVEARQEIDNPYIIGVPLTEQQEIFIGRTDISLRIEQLLRDQRRPPLLLYGQRRMGKTSLLNNLGRLLPTTIVPLFVDLQGASRASHHAGLLYNIARDMIKSARMRREVSLPALTQTMLAADPFTHFDEWLDRVEQVLEQHHHTTALLALDEFETLESAIVKGRFDEEDVLGMLRHLIQHRARFKVLLAGSHHLVQFQRWASYLINVQVVHISYLQEAEARQLIERPVKEITLRYEPEASRRVLALTRGHPFLIQLLCAEIVALKNEQPPAVRRLATLADVETAVPAALTSGSFFFADIERNQVDPTGLALLQLMARQSDGLLTISDGALDVDKLPDALTLDQALDQLLRRELIEPFAGGYRFQVELIRRWFARY